MNREKVLTLMEDAFRKKVKKDKNIRNAYLLVHSDKLGIHLDVSEGSTDGLSSNPQQPNHIASIGKLFTAILLALLEQQGKLTYEDSIIQYLETGISEGLHVYKGIEYSHQIKIKHLLNHTSGLHDYFDDKPKDTKPMISQILEEPDYFWTPQEVILWSKKHLTPHFPPGEGFHYSDTGYHILGLIIEKVTGLPFHQALTEYIFDPLNMKHTYLAHYSEPREKSPYPVANLYTKDINVIHYRSLSIDYAGGGIIAPTEDLLRFMKALTNFDIISKASFEKMKDWSKFSIGIDYGYGLMNFVTIPVIMPSKYNIWGNCGSVGSFMFYHPVMDTYLIGNLNQFRYHSKGIRLMLKMIDILHKYHKKTMQ
ncbi:serine hydrolase domain-containing protein [Alkaliphilus hydrothermalis]|uniref:D-alanyl-D-alanine carboxypeptidase n=1 Tax=Alkaliphilus hydrothermalis TaxID=1482730 RepID=A0ABS2NSD7_9FIRM|nr:serine hydrolase domain-containing protein [Alkaliphilus hydrothermalis]MBM7615850.1 D-alanyl-D-alanine carboxypeptidase [Alkaliphilus hydrothermalis]